VTATTTTLTKSMADEFFKRWRRRRDKNTWGNTEPWADGQMQDVTREVLEELGFPPLKNEAGNEVPRGLYTNPSITKYKIPFFPFDL
jgi:hypothetical protein